jgi:hypothetical protein
VAGGGCAVFLYLVNPHSHQVFLPCPFHAATGMYCPACGGLRMVHDLLHGNLTAALHDNALAIPVVLIGFAAWLNWAIRRWRGQPRPASPAWLTPVSVAALIVWTVVRNLPWAPFAAMRPMSLPCGTRRSVPGFGKRVGRLRRGRLVGAADSDQRT